MYTRSQTGLWEGLGAGLHEGVSLLAAASIAAPGGRRFVGLQHHPCNTLVLLRLQHWLGTAMPGLYLNSLSDGSQAMAAAICAFGAPVEQIIVEDQQC